MKLIKKKTEVWNGVKKIRLAEDFFALTEKQWFDNAQSYYMTLLTYPEDEKSGKMYKDFLAFYNHIIKELKIKTI
tara:strand:+ start:15294 stop:15518 length:225 start_codon:yes stop_codon:yes gene_type:complete